MLDYCFRYQIFMLLLFASDYTFRMMQGTYIYWNLRLTCDYAHQEGEHKLRGLTMHGLWLSRISGSRVVHLSKNTYGDEWCADLKTAESVSILNVYLLYTLDSVVLFFCLPGLLFFLSVD